MIRMFTLCEAPSRLKLSFPVEMHASLMRLSFRMQSQLHKTDFMLCSPWIGRDQVRVKVDRTQIPHPANIMS